MNINYFLKCSMANGPGKRFVLWVQGCNFGIKKKCPACRNTDTHSFEKNIIMSEEDILVLIPENSDGLTISGGEPFDQADSTLKLCRLFKEKYPDKNIMIFTGYIVHELINKKIFEEIKSYVDMLVVGRFVENMQDNESWKKWAGSSNQILMFLNDKIDKSLVNKNRVEVIIGNETIVTGFPTSEDLSKFFSTRIL